MPSGGYWIGYFDEAGSPVLQVLDPALVPPTTPTDPPVRPGVVYVPPPSPAALAVFLGWPPLDEEQTASALAHVERATALVMAYTRGQGCNGAHLTPALAQVVLSLAGRSMANPTGDARIEAGAFKASPGQPEWTVQERLIMNEYRRRVT